MRAEAYFHAIAQISGAIILMLLLVAAPSRQGTMLLWPMGGQDGQGVAALAVAAGAIPVGRTANGVLIVQGELARLMQAMLPYAILPLATASRLCRPERASDA